MSCDYAELGLTRSATTADVKAAFRKLSMAWHPDLNKSPGAEAKFKRLSAAYTALTKGDAKAADGPRTTQQTRARVMAVQIELSNIMHGFTFQQTNGTGQTIKLWNIPAGTRDGQIIRLDAMNELKIVVLKHPDFEIDGQNVIWRTTIKKSQNKKGHEVTISLPEGGTKTVELPGTIDSDHFLNVNKMGIPNYGTKLHYNQLMRQAGNLHVYFTVIDDTPWLVKKAKALADVLKYT